MVSAVVLVADELVDRQPRDQLARSLASVAYESAKHRRVWVVGPPGLVPASPPEGGAWEQAESLSDLPPLAAGRGSTVLVVGGRPERSIRWANRHRLKSVLVVPEPGEDQQPGSLDEAPDFVLESVEDVLGLIRRIEREEGDFEGTE
ncbi:MAG: hypothetical protein IMX02_00955 [Limnochordaceae bacterium]|nr:hypothetical protein [Limnochordaceae bacterium]